MRFHQPLNHLISTALKKEYFRAKSLLFTSHGVKQMIINNVTDVCSAIFPLTLVMCIASQCLISKTRWR